MKEGTMIVGQLAMVAGLERIINGAISCFVLDELAGAMNAGRMAASALVDAGVLEYRDKERAASLAYNAICEVERYRGRKALAASRILTAFFASGLLHEPKK